ncbi:MAG: CoA-binding protein [Hydrogenophilales bacterium]|nr:CoA-binding protein [Hydrogenophilales bacterium]
MPFQNPAPDEIKALLARVKNIAVVGLSPKPNRPSFVVARALQGFGYRVIPVRPALNEVLGEKAYPSLAEVPDRIDLVDAFRAAGHLDELVDECIRLKLPALWIQEGIVNLAAAERARAAGLFVVMDRCIYKDYVSLMA